VAGIQNEHKKSFCSFCAILEYSSMLRAFWLVLVDLWNFFLGFEATKVASLPARPVSPELPSKPAPVQIMAEKEPLSLPAVPTTEVAPAVTATVPLPLEPVTASAETLHKPGMLYVVKVVTGTHLLKDPLVQFDTVLRHVPYGQLVALRRFVGSYAEVLVFGLVGFIHKDALTPDLLSIWPTLVTGTVYQAESEVAAIYRTHINDEFLGGVLQLPLTAEEYITVRLLRDRQAIAWPSTRPRLAGTWHTLLRGVPGIHNQITPEPDTIMEWFLEDGVPRLAYVEAVLPDETLKISAVGIMVPGEYTESIVPASLWREWRPVFINVR
jgi:hypothetical protein